MGLYTANNAPLVLYGFLGVADRFLVDGDPAKWRDDRWEEHRRMQDIHQKPWLIVAVQ